MNWMKWPVLMLATATVLSLGNCVMAEDAAKTISGKASCGGCSGVVKGCCLMLTDSNGVRWVLRGDSKILKAAFNARHSGKTMTATLAAGTYRQERQRRQGVQGGQSVGSQSQIVMAHGQPTCHKVKVRALAASARCFGDMALRPRRVYARKESSVRRANYSSIPRIAHRLCRRQRMSSDKIRRQVALGSRPADVRPGGNRVLPRKLKAARHIAKGDFKPGDLPAIARSATRSRSGHASTRAKADGKPPGHAP